MLIHDQNTKHETRVTLMGLGYIGLPTAALLANSNFTVRGVDVVPSVVDTINRGEIHIVEPDLDAFVRAAVGSGRLVAALQPAEADVFIIAVPTPFKEGYEPDLAYVEAAARSIAPVLRPGNLVILESTSPVGTTERLAQVLQEAGADTDSIHICYCPERVLPGHVMRELIENDRIVGGLTPEATDAGAAFYERFVTGQVLRTNARTAEMCKLTENASRDAQIAFANELSMVCDRMGINVWELIRLANKHPRVNILRPGPGVGGHCIAVDPWFIVNAAPEEAKLIRQAREVNTYKTHWVEEKIHRHAAELAASLGHKPIIAMMGLAFKPDIDDLRESPALELAQAATAWGTAAVICVEPHVQTAPKGLALASQTDALAHADLIVYLVAHAKFKAQPPPQGKPVLDFCGLWAG